jgi:tetratricopeptide (TPR) repeat protein
MEIAMQAKQMCEEIHYPNGSFRALLTLGFINAGKKNNDAAIENFSEAAWYGYQLEDNDKVLRALNNLGKIYLLAGNEQMSVKTFTTSLKLAEENGDMENIADSYKNLGMLYLSKKDYQSAIDPLQKSAFYYESLTNIQEMAALKQAIGDTWYGLADFDKAAENYVASLHLYEKIGDEEHKINALTHAGDAMIENHKLDDAKQLYFTELNNQPASILSETVMLLEKISEIAAMTGNTEVAADRHLLAMNAAKTLCIEPSEMEASSLHAAASNTGDCDHVSAPDTSKLALKTYKITLVADIRTQLRNEFNSRIMQAENENDLLKAELQSVKESLDMERALNASLSTELQFAKNQNTEFKETSRFNLYSLFSLAALLVISFTALLSVIVKQRKHLKKTRWTLKEENALLLNEVNLLKAELQNIQNKTTKQQIANIGL